MVESRVVCCCGVHTWTVVIAWIQIVLKSIEALIVILAMAGVAVVTLDDKDTNGHTKAAVMVVLAILLVIYLGAICFGVLLLRGATQRRPSYLKAWMIYAVVIMVFAIIGASFGTGQIAFRIVQCLISIGVYSFGLWVVYIHKEEIEHEGRVGDLPATIN